MRRPSRCPLSTWRTIRSHPLAQPCILMDVHAVLREITEARNLSFLRRTESTTYRCASAITRVLAAYCGFESRVRSSWPCSRHNVGLVAIVSVVWTCDDAIVAGSQGRQARQRSLLSSRRWCLSQLMIALMISSSTGRRRGTARHRSSAGTSLGPLGTVASHDDPRHCSACAWSRR